MDARTSSFSIRNETELKRFVKSHANATPEQLVEAITISLNLAVTAHNADVHHRLNAGRMFVELRQKVEAEGADWWQWQKGKFDRSRKDIEKLMRMARADDPEAAAQEERASARERMQKVRDGANVRSMAAAGVEFEERDAGPDETENPDQMSPAEDAKSTLDVADLRIGEAYGMAQGCLVVLPRIKKSKLKDVLKGTEMVLAEWTKVKEQIEPEFDERVSAEADPVESFNAAFATLEVAIQDVKGDSWRRVVNELGEDRIFRLVSRLKSAIDDYGTPRQRRAGVQSAADRAEARAQGKV